MAEIVVQRIVLPPRRGLDRLYCRFQGESSRSRKQGRRCILLPRGTIVQTDTWFNAFFERYWREYTHLSDLVLRLRISGTGAIRLCRRRSDGRDLLKTIDFSGQDEELHLEPAGTAASPAGNGLLYFEIEAGNPQLMLHHAEWLARNVVPQPIRLVAGICTFNRVHMLVSNIMTLFADPGVADVLERIIVVDQGEEKVRDHPAFVALMRAAAGRLQLVEQDNRGGAGGFTRCLLEAQNTGSATHVLLMDDDIIAEPESVLRAAAFLSLARGDVAVGGHMLDRFQPCQLVDSGSRFLPQRVRIDEPSRSRLDRIHDLLPFLEPRDRHYNGWWFFAFPLAVLDRAGLPLPLFLRGDDLEFGCRLMRLGVPTLAPPGIAVWHEPCEQKNRGWHAFFELRNLLIVGALHFPIVHAATVARQFLSRLLDELLTYDYYEAWLMCEAVAAYLHSPNGLRRPPGSLQQRFLAMGEKLASKVQPSTEDRRAGSVIDSDVTVAHAAGFSLRVRRWLLVFRNFLWPSPSADARPQRTLRGGGEHWYDISSADVIRVADSHHKQAVVLRRSRGKFICLISQGMWLAIRLLLGHRRAARRWRASISSLTSRTFWSEYLGQTHLLRHRLAAAPRDAFAGAVGRQEYGTEKGDHEQAQDSLLQLD